MRTRTKIFAVLLSLLSLTAFITCNQNQKTTPIEPEGFSFAFLTDVHLMPMRNADDGFAKAIQTVNELDPDFVITGGDLIMDALGVSYDTADIQYNLYTSMLESFDMPVHNTLGNHEVFGWYQRSGTPPDHPEYGKKMYENRIGPRYDVFEYKGWKFLILDSVIPNGEGGYMGGIDEGQIEWIKDVLAETDTAQPIIISTHIPFMTVATQLLKGATIPNPRGGVITNSKEVLDLFAGYNLKLVLQGHLHFLEEINVWGTQFITAGAVSAGWWNGAYMKTEEGFLMVHIGENNDFTWEYIDYGWEVEPGTHPPLY
jgi:3',5'-cyclic AMP phosphodiesterase CpdA